MIIQAIQSQNRLRENFNYNFYKRSVYICDELALLLFYAENNTQPRAVSISTATQLLVLKINMYYYLWFRTANNLQT